MDSMVIYGIAKHLVDPCLYGKSCREVLEQVFGYIPPHDAIMINGVAVDIDEAAHPIYDNAVIRVIPRLETKGAC